MVLHKSLIFALLLSCFSFGEFLETDSLLGNNQRFQLNDTTVIKTAPSTSSPDSLFCTTSGSNIVKKCVYPDSLGFSDSTRASWKSDTSGKADTARASYISDTSKISHNSHYLQHGVTQDYYPLSATDSTFVDGEIFQAQTDDSLIFFPGNSGPRFHLNKSLGKLAITNYNTEMVKILYGSNGAEYHSMDSTGPQNGHAFYTRVEAQGSDDSLMYGFWHDSSRIIPDVKMSRSLEVSNGFGLGIAPDATTLFKVYRNDGTATPLVELEQDGAGDASLLYQLTGGQAYTIGIDNSDGDYLKISPEAELSNTDYLCMDASGYLGLGIAPVSNNLFTAYYDPSDNTNANLFSCQYYPTCTSTGSYVYYGFNFNCKQTVNTGATNSGIYAPVNTVAYKNGAGTLTWLIANQTTYGMYTDGAGTVTNAIGSYYRLRCNGGSIGLGCDLYFAAPGLSGGSVGSEYTIYSLHDAPARFINDLEIDDDAYGLSLGDGQDAKIHYNGSNMVYNSQVVGSGDHYFTGGDVGIGVTPSAKLDILDTYYLRFGNNLFGFAGPSIMGQTTTHIGSYANSFILYAGNSSRLVLGAGATGDFNFNSGQLFVEGSDGSVTIESNLTADSIYTRAFKQPGDSSFAAYCSLYEGATYRARALCYFLVKAADSLINITGPQITAAFSASGQAYLKNPNIKASKAAGVYIATQVYDDSNGEMGYIRITAGTFQIEDLSPNGTDGIEPFSVTYRY